MQAVTKILFPTSTYRQLRKLNAVFIQKET